MALTGKLEAEVEIPSHGDLFHKLSHETNEIVKIHPELFQICDAHEGEFGKVGAIIDFKYTLGGKSYSAKDRVEVIDEENKIFKLVAVEGDILVPYQSFHITLQVVPKGDVDLVKWTLDYEKRQEGVPEPHVLLEALIDLIKKIGDLHSKA